MRPAAKFCRKALRSARTAVCLWNIQTALPSPTHPTLRHRIQLRRNPIPMLCPPAVLPRHPAAFRNRVIPELIRPAAIPAMAHSRTSPRASRSPIPNSPTMDSSPSRITGSRETAAIFRRSSRAIRAVTRIIPRTIRTTAPTARQLPDWCWAFSPS